MVQLKNDLLDLYYTIVCDCAHRVQEFASIRVTLTAFTATMKRIESPNSFGKEPGTARRQKMDLCFVRKCVLCNKVFDVGDAVIIAVWV